MRPQSHYVFSYQVAGQPVTSIVEAADASQAVASFTLAIRQHSKMVPSYSFLGRLVLDEMPGEWERKLESDFLVEEVAVRAGEPRFVTRGVDVADEGAKCHHEAYRGSRDPITCGAALRYVAEEYREVIGGRRAGALVVVAAMVEGSIGL